MRKIVLVYGLLAGAFIALLQTIQYRFLVVDHAVELYGALVALLFAALGIWLGLRLTARRVVVREVRVPVPVEVPTPVPTLASPAEPFVPDAARLERLGITRREHEILGLIAAGLSNREIAERLSVSEHTVKTHAGRLLDKLGARRRTEAVRLAREAGIIA